MNDKNFITFWRVCLHSKANGIMPMYRVLCMCYCDLCTRFKIQQAVSSKEGSWSICDSLHQTMLKYENLCRMNFVYNMQLTPVCVSKDNSELLINHTGYQFSLCTDIV